MWSCAARVIISPLLNDSLLDIRSDMNPWLIEKSSCKKMAELF